MKTIRDLYIDLNRNIAAALEPRPEIDWQSRFGEAEDGNNLYLSVGKCWIWTANVRIYTPNNFLSPAVFWPEFEKWLKAQKQGAMFNVNGNEVSSFWFYIRVTTDGPRDIEADFTSGNLLEAGCRAWLAALTAMKEGANEERI